MSPETAGLFPWKKYDVDIYLSWSPGADLSVGAARRDDDPEGAGGGGAVELLVLTVRDVVTVTQLSHCGKTGMIKFMFGKKLRPVSTYLISS